jgi:D-tyrosyl-tRNA(Tyr) deacylase
MRALIQRVKWAKVSVGGQIVGEIGPGILTLLGIKNTDTEKEVEWTMSKISKLRVFEDNDGKMNLSLLDLKLEHLIVSQFTLYGDTEQGNRPGFADAARPDLAQALYEKALHVSRDLGIKTEAGKFQAHMEVSLLNDGPATFLIESL